MHTEILGDIVIPVGRYKVNEGGQEKWKKRHRAIGTLMHLHYDDGQSSYSVKLNIEMLSPSVAVLLSRNKIMEDGDDTVFCRVYARDKAKTAAAPPPPAAAGEVDDVQPF